MFLILKQRPHLILTGLLLLPGCGGGSMPAPTVTGMVAQSQPSNAIASSAMASPKNRVSFSALLTYSDGSVSASPLSGVQWSDGDPWVSLSGNVATCTQPAPVLILGPEFSTVTATAQVNGKSYTVTSGLYCL